MSYYKKRLYTHSDEPPSGETAAVSFTEMPGPTWHGSFLDTDNVVGVIHPDGSGELVVIEEDE